VTKAARTSPRTALGLLFGPDEDTLAALTHQILLADAGGHLDGALKNLRKATRHASAREAAIQACGLLDADLIGLVITGWRAHRDLVIAARRTLAAPGRTELADLATHRITTGQQPAVTICVGGQQVTTVQFGLRIEFDVTAMVAQITAGRLAAFASGHCDTTITLAVGGTDMLTRHAHLELPGVIPVSPGLRLLPAHAYALAEESDQADLLPMMSRRAS
jgi:hypothetical protein